MTNYIKQYKEGQQAIKELKKLEEILKVSDDLFPLKKQLTNLDYAELKDIINIGKNNDGSALNRLILTITDNMEQSYAQKIIHSEIPEEERIIWIAMARNVRNFYTVFKAVAAEILKMKTD